MEEEKMLVPSGLKTVDGKDIMCYTGAFYLKNEEKIKRIIKKCEEILDAESEDIKEIQRNIKIKEDSEKCGFYTIKNGTVFINGNCSDAEMMKMAKKMIGS